MRNFALSLFLGTILAVPVCAGAQQIAITVDDLPEHSSLPLKVTRIQIATQMIQALKDAGVPPVYGFVNAKHLETHPEEARVLDQWRAAGFLLGNHTWSHMNLNENTLEAFEQNLAQGEPAIRSRMEGKDWKWLRFPFLAEGNTPEKHAAIRSYLAEHGYKIADVTMSFQDYRWNPPYARCLAKGDAQSIAYLESSYLEAARYQLHYERALSQALYKRDIPYVLLLHIGAFDAHMLQRLLKMYQDEGVSFLSLPEAEKDSFYAAETNPALPSAPETLEGTMAAKQLPIPPHTPPALHLDNLCKE